MARLCKAGRTIICTIHQPSSIIYRKFDKVMFLADGRLAYFGEPTKAVEMLDRFGYPCPTNYNPADMIIEVLSIEPNNESVCRDRIQNIITSFNNSLEGEQFLNLAHSCRFRVGEIPEVRRTSSCWVQV